MEASEQNEKAKEIVNGCELSKIQKRLFSNPWNRLAHKLASSNKYAASTFVPSM